MFYTILDKKLLARMISAQSDLQQWVIIDSLTQTIYHSCGWESNYVASAFSSGNKFTLALKPYEIDLALDNLESLGFVETAPGGPAVRVTYRGWYDKAMRFREAVFSLLHNLLLPVIAAIGSSIITTLIMQLIASHT